MRRMIFLTTLLLMLTGTLALAQPSRGERPWRQQRNPEEMTEAFRLYKMTEYLELTEEQTARIYPQIAAMKKGREEHREQMRAKMKELRELVEEEKWSKAAKLGDELHAMKETQMTAAHEAHGELLKMMSDEQRAKFMLFEQRFNRHLRRVGERMKGRRGGPGGPGGPTHGGPPPGGPGGFGPGGECDQDGPHGPRGGGRPGNCGPGGW